MSTQVKYTQEGAHQFITGSSKKIVQDHTFYIHEAELRAISYKGTKLIDNLAFRNLYQLREWLAGEVYKLEMGNKLIPNHNLDVKTVLVAHSNPKDPSGNKVSFYEVVELVDVCTVKLRELHKEVVTHQNYLSAIPSVGNYLNSEVIERKVVSNSVKIKDEVLAVRLPFELLMIGDVLPIKVYKPASFGISA